MTDLATMLRNQMQQTLQNSLDTAVQAGDINAARNATKQILDLNLAEARSGSAAKKVPSKDEIKAAVAAKADWFGVDPRKTAKAVELGKMMDPERFDSAEAFATALLKSLDDEATAAAAAGKSDDEDGDDDEDDGKDGAEDEGERQPRKRKNATERPELGAGGAPAVTSNLRRAFESGDIKALPRAAQDSIKKSADKLARNADEKGRKTFIANAVKAHARAELIASGKFDARSNKFK
jgi:hypothetical protein